MPTQHAPELLRTFNVNELTQPRRPGVVRLSNFIGESSLRGMQDEIASLQPRQWQTPTPSQRVFAHKLSRGDQTHLANLPELRQGVEKIVDVVRSMGLLSLSDWEADDFAIHHDQAPIQPSPDFHRTNERFWGVVPVLSVKGASNLAIKTPGGVPTYRFSQPGDLILLRAPGIIDEASDFRPEHVATDFSEDSRLALMVRANRQPDAPIPDSTHHNWDA